MIFRKRFVRRKRGAFQLGLDDNERAVLGRLVDELRQVLDDDDANTRRLFPTAYNDDPDLDAGYQVLAHDELLAKKLTGLDAIETHLDADEIDEATLSAWMSGVNDIRLVLGTSLDVSEDDIELDPDDPTAYGHLVYHFLGALLEEMVAVMSETLPPPTDDDI